jgi:predicted transcriptional regulator of viral defense system
MPSEEEIANRLYRPSYLSFEYALAFHNILPEMPYDITSATTISSRSFTISSKTFSFFKIKIKAYTGYGLNKIGEKYFLIAEPEKALVDYLYFVALGKKPLNERLNLENLNKRKIMEYAALFDRPRLNKLIKEQL